LVNEEPCISSSEVSGLPQCRFVEPGRDVSRQRLLARIEFGARGGRPFIDDGVPTLPLRMYDDARDGFIEQWRVAGTTQSGQMDDLVFAHDDAVIFCAGFIPAGDEYADAAHRMYADAFALIRRLEFPRIFRMWNYIPRINGANREGLEVYRDFCRGRAQAFEEDYASTSGMPAATGIGTWGEGVGCYFLACREQAVRHIENTRQTPAYRYPSRYGPKAPSFARASLIGDAMFVSGTASIVGSETVHAGDLRRQWETTIANVAHLIGAENLAAHDVDDGFTLAALDHIKVYYRHAHDLAAVRRLAQATFAPHASVRFINVDICRDDLLVEIEGIASRARRLTSM
jgi:chorismate lyase / 3-hydroxybenzoate synthase